MTAQTEAEPGFDPTQTALALVDEARTAILDWRTQPLTEAVCELAHVEALRVVQALAMVAGSLAVEHESGWRGVRSTYASRPDRREGTVTR